MFIKMCFLQLTRGAGWTGCCRLYWCGCWTVFWCQVSWSGCWYMENLWRDRILDPLYCSGDTASRQTWTWQECVFVLNWALTKSNNPNQALFSPSATSMLSGRLCSGQPEPLDLPKGPWPSFAHLSVGPRLRSPLVFVALLPPASLGGSLAGHPGRTAAIRPPPTGRCMQEQPRRCTGLPPLASATHDRFGRWETT